MKKIQRIFLAITLTSATGWLVAPAHADLLTVAGSDSGTFSPNPANSHLSFASASFGPTSGDTLTLGMFSLGAGTETYTGVFDLTVTFSTPPGTSGSIITGDLTGQVNGNSGSATITFTNPTLFTFPGGSFDLSANAVTVDAKGTAMLTGTLSNENLSSQTSLPTVPEPFSLVLFGTCVVTMGFARRKRWI